MELSKRELRAVLLAGHITKKEQVRTNTGYLDSAKKNALIDELKAWVTQISKLDHNHR